MFLVAHVAEPSYITHAAAVFGEQLAGMAVPDWRVDLWHYTVPYHWPQPAGSLRAGVVIDRIVVLAGCITIPLPVAAGTTERRVSPAGLAWADCPYDFDVISVLNWMSAHFVG